MVSRKNRFCGVLHANFKENKYQIVAKLAEALSFPRNLLKWRVMKMKRFTKPRQTCSANRYL